MPAIALPSPTCSAGVDYADRIPFDFGVGYVNPETVPVEALADLAGAAIRGLGDDLARYPARRGWEPLRAVAARLRERRGEPAPELDSIVLANGALGAIALATAALTEAGDTVLVEEWTYNVAMTLFRQRGLRLRPVAMDAEGLLPDALDAACAQTAGRAVLYTIPTFHNPTGIVMPLARRREIAAIARAHEIAILEDDCYGDLRIDGADVPSLWSLAPERTALIGSFSKILSPALRLGFVVAPEGTVDDLLARKLDGGTDQLASAIAAEFLARHGDAHLVAIRARLRARRDHFITALRERLPRAMLQRVPEGGLYAWVRLPDDTGSGALLAALAADGVAFFATTQCRADRADGPFVRFAYAWPSPDETERGLDRLAEVLSR